MAVRASIGLKRIPGGTRDSVAGATRSIRAQLSDINRNLQKVIDGFENVTPEAVFVALHPIFKESQRLVPVDTSTLKNSGYLEVEKTTRGVEAEIGYALGGKPHYAVLVHEMVGVAHDDPTQAKFLQQPLEAQMHRIAPRIAAAIKKGIGL